MADRLREKVRQSFAAPGPEITVSIGVGCIHEPNVATAADLVRQADKALYYAKRTGKNKVERPA